MSTSPEILAIIGRIIFLAILSGRPPDRSMSYTVIGLVMGAAIEPDTW
jgi:hypothetical protein